MAGEALHEGGVAVSATVSAPNIRVDAVIVALDTRPGKDGFCYNLSDLY